MTTKHKSIAKAITPKNKVVESKITKESLNKKITSESIHKPVKKDNSKSIASAIKAKNKDNCESNAKVLPEKSLAVIGIDPQIKHNVVSLANEANGLIEMLKWFREKQKNVIEIPELKIDTKALGSKIITKTFKVSEKAIKKLMELAEKHPHLKHQDLLGMAIIEFVEKYHIG